MNNSKKIIPDYKNKEFRNKRGDIIFELAQELTPIMNELHDKEYSFSYWLWLLQDHLKVCVNRRSYLLKPDYHEPVLKYPINSWFPLQKRKILKNYLVFLLRAIKYKVNLNEELEKIYQNQNLLLGQRADEFKYYIEGVKINRFYIWRIFFKKGNKKKRNKLIALSKTVDSLILSKIMQSMPTVLVEHYDFINSLFEVRSPNEKRFHVEHGDSFFTVFLMAKYREKGAKIISYQGGGFQGEVVNHPNKIKYEICDEFHTYGWKVHPKDFPDKPYRLMQYKRKWDYNRLLTNEKYKNKVLVVFSIINDEHIHKYLKFSNSFFSSIPQKLYDKIIVRLRPTTIKANKNLEARKLKVPSNITVDGGEKKMSEAAAKVEIVILTTLPATSFLECIYVGQPVMAVNTNENPSELFSEFVPDLERLGVIHKTPSALTDFFLKIENYQQWWIEVERDPIFQNFATLFAGKVWNEKKQNKLEL